MKSATFSRILEIFEISVFLYFWTPGNIGNLIFLYFWTPGNIGNLSLQHSPESWKYYPNPEPNPKSLFLINIYPCSAPDRAEVAQVGTPLYFCAQARYLRALGLRRGLRCPEDVSMETQVSQSVPQDCPRCSKEATKVPKRETKGAQCGPQSMPWHSKVRSKESHIPQNSRSTAPAATMLVISVAVLLVLLPFGLLLLSLVLIPSPLHYYPYYYTTTGGEWWGLVCPARPPERPPRPGAYILLCYYYY